MAWDELPEPADIVRLARQLLRRAAQVARSDDDPAGWLLARHFGGTAGISVVTGSWPGFDHVNLQVAVDAWLAGPGRSHRLAGLTGPPGGACPAGLAELMRPDTGGQGRAGISVGSVAMTARPSGPGGQTRLCARAGLYLVSDCGAPLALLLRGPEDTSPGGPGSGANPGSGGGTSLQVACASQRAAQQVLAEISRLMLARNVFRGQMITFGPAGTVGFLDRPQPGQDCVILPDSVLAGIERQVLGVARHAGALTASGQHLRRGVLLHGPPGTGKTHTIRYLLGRMPGVTAAVLPPHAMDAVSEACRIAAALQPAAVIVEDLDQIPGEPSLRTGQYPLVSRLLAEMEALGTGADVTFLLTTSRPDLLEAALAARPGSINHTAELPFPDARARRRLIELYRGSLTLELSDPEAVVARTDGVTAAFIRELLRRAALIAAEDGQQAASPPGAAGPQPPAGGLPAPLVITDAHLNTALEQLLDVRAWLTRTLLGERAGGSGQDAVIRPMGTDLLIRRPRSSRPGQ